MLVRVQAEQEREDGGREILTASPVVRVRAAAASARRMKEGVGFDMAKYLDP